MRPIRVLVGLVFVYLACAGMAWLAIEQLEEPSSVVHDIEPIAPALPAPDAVPAVIDNREDLQTPKDDRRGTRGEVPLA